MLRKMLVTATLAMSMAGCNTVTIHPEAGPKQIAQPSYEDSKNFFLFGLVGEERVDVAAVCGDGSVTQMQSQQTFLDGLYGGLTLGIYVPHTVKVGCK